MLVELRHMKLDWKIEAICVAVKDVVETIDVLPSIELEIIAYFNHRLHEYSTNENKPSALACVSLLECSTSRILAASSKS